MRYYFNKYRKISLQRTFILIALLCVFLFFGIYFVFFLKKIVGIVLILIGLIGLYDILISLTKWFKKSIFVDISDTSIEIHLNYFQKPDIIKWDEISSIHIYMKKIIIYRNLGKEITLNPRKLPKVEMKSLIKDIFHSAGNNKTEVIF